MQFHAILSKEHRRSLHHCFLASAHSTLGLLPAPMDLIPLLCKICPEEPHFSDLSHLLTHVSSKGHLYQCKNAQLRSHHDDTFHERLEAYNTWYDVNQIEKLLAQRMAQKDSKSAKGKSRHLRDRSSVVVKAEEPQQKSKRKQPIARRPTAKPTTQVPIDPQLSLFLEPGDGLHWSGHRSPRQEPRPLETAPLHRTHIVRARSRTPAILQYDLDFEHANCLGARSFMIKSDVDEEGELQWPYPSSPLKPSYPDPSTLAAHSAVAPHPTPIMKSRQSKASTPNRGSTNGQSPQLSEASGAHLLRLKGPHYPGMALFDSASPNSQRLRNQKKEHSLLASMERNSDMVEPIEQIYFPEWTLKKARVITGNVESSPIQEVTPKPKRRRAKLGKIALGELSTNIPTTKGIPRAAKAPIPSRSLQVAGLEDPFTRDVSRQKDASDYKNFQNRPEEAVEWCLNMGMPKFTSSRKFAVFEDSRPPGPTHTSQTFGNQPSANNDILTQSQYTELSNTTFLEAPARSRMNKAAVGLGASLSIMKEGSGGAVQQKLPDQRSTTSTLRRIDPEKENTAPILSRNGDNVNEARSAEPERITQRYFSVTGNDPPQFFNSLPPQMDFGGLSDHRLWGSSVNPLNPQNRQQQHGSYLHIFQQLNAFKVSHNGPDRYDGQSHPNLHTRGPPTAALPKPSTKHTRSRK